MRIFILIFALYFVASHESLSQSPAAAGNVITIAGNGLVGFSGDAGPATNAALNQILGLAFGRDGTLYFADEGNLRIRAIDPITGIVRTVAGTGVGGDEGNDGPAINANFSSIFGLATDRDRNALYITDWGNNWVRKMNLNDGIITRYAGSGNFGMNGQGGPAALAELAFPLDAATDAAGRLSFIDSHNRRVCRVDPVTGIISTIAGGPGVGPAGDGGPAVGAALGSPTSLTADPAGNVFLRDGDPNGTYCTVRRIDAATGIITTIAGGGTNAPGTGVATNMFFRNIAVLAANGSGELFVATPLQVFKLKIATGILTLYAGDGTSDFGNEGDPALMAKFASITSIAVAPDGGLVIADSGNARIRYVAPAKVQPATSSHRIVAIAGNGSGGFSGDGGPALDGSLSSVAGLAFGPDGTLYVSDTGNLRIRAVDPITGKIRTIAGTGIVGDEGNGGPATNANLTTVIGLATDHSRNALYFSEYGNFWARKINLTDGIISLYAGTGTPGPGGDGGLATATRLRRPISAATDAFGKFYFSDYSSSRVRSVDPVSGIINTIAGTGISGVPSGDGGPGTSATIGSPMRLTADPAGNVYLRDGDPNGTYFMVRRIDAATGIITTIVGGGTNTPGTGVATNMFFDNIGEVAANDAGELFVGTPSRIFKLNIATGMIAPFAGDGTNGATTNGIPALTARFSDVTAMTAAPGGGVVFSDGARVYHIGPDKPRATSSGTIITIAGRGIGYSGDGGPAANALVSDGVIAMAFGPDGTLYFGDIGNGRVRAIDPLSGIIRTVAGNGSLVGQDQDVGDGGPATNAAFGGIHGLAVDRARNVLYVADDGNNRVRKVDLMTGIISKFAGKGLFNGYGLAGDGGPAADAKFAEIRGIGLGVAGRLLITDQNNGRIRQVNPMTGIITTLAGIGDFIGFHPCADAGNGGPATNAFLGAPLFVMEDPFGNVFDLESGEVCPTVNFVAIRRIDAVTGIITRVAGGGASVPGEGSATNMNLQTVFTAHPAIDDAGNIFLASFTQVFKLNPNTGMLSVFAGDGVAGDGGHGDGGPASQARFARILGLAVAPGGGLVISDSGNGRIRYIAPDSINLSGDSGQTSFTLRWVNELSGNLILENNTNLTTINLATLTTVSGELVLTGNTAASGSLDLGSLESAGSVNISENTAAGVLDLGLLVTVSGDLVLDGNAVAGELDLGSLETTSGDLVITDNTSTTVINLASLTSVGGDLVLTNNGASGDLDLGSLETVSGDLTIEEPPGSGDLDLSSLAEVSGDLTLQSNESGDLDLSSLTEYGCGTNEVTMTLDGSFAMTNGITLCSNATLAGSATVDGSVTNNGTMEPGSSPGRLNITRNLHLGPTSRLNLEIGGFGQAEFDSINVDGNTTLGGTLTIRLLDSFVASMTNGASFTVLTSGQSLGGAFANVASGGTLTTTDGRGRATVRYAGENMVRLTDFEVMPGGAELRIISVEKQPDGVLISWNSVGGQSYRVEFTSSLDKPFTDQSPVITAPGNGESTLHFDSNVSAESPGGFYRVRMVE